MIEPCLRRALSGQPALAPSPPGAGPAPARAPWRRVVVDTVAELRAAEALADAVAIAGGPALAAHLGGAGAAATDHAVAQGVADVDHHVAERVARAAAGLLIPSIDRLDGDGEPLACADCGRPVAYDYDDDAYHHVIAPARGCFLIPPDPARAG